LGRREESPFGQLGSAVASARDISTSTSSTSAGTCHGRVLARAVVVARVGRGNPGSSCNERTTNDSGALAAVGSTNNARGGVGEWVQVGEALGEKAGTRVPLGRCRSR
jgi:hypothetical protein